MEMVLQQHQQISTGVASTTTCRPGPGSPPPPPRKATMKQEEEEDDELRRGPWTVDEDLILVNYIADHGEGRWNALARAAGLKRTGKSCRLRWLNYLRPDVKRGDFTADEQLLILDLHSRWGNRWSKIAQQLPGRTDNEIKNYWRTRVQKHARQLNCDVNSRQFRDAMTYLWMPRLAERAAASCSRHSSQQHQHSAVAGGSCSDAHKSPCLSALTTTTSPARGADPAACLAENTNSYYHSPGGGASGSSSCVVPSSSSSDSSLTSTDSSSTAAVAAHEAEKSAHGHLDDICWATTMQQGADLHEFWTSAAAALPVEEPMSDVQDLTGWVQGFSDEGISFSSDAHSSSSLWSLDDIWRMQ